MSDWRGEGGSKPPNWDPDPEEKDWYSHHQTGQRGWMVRRAGRDMIKLDRAMEEILEPFNPSVWLLNKDFRPFTRAQCVIVAFEADRAFCRLQHIPTKVSEFSELSDRARELWIFKGPKDPKRQELYRAVMGVLSEFMPKDER